jgi:hypothetical protein
VRTNLQHHQSQPGHRSRVGQSARRTDYRDQQGITVEARGWRAVEGNDRQERLIWSTTAVIEAVDAGGDGSMVLDVRDSNGKCLEIDVVEASSRKEVESCWV